jgi:hypothetical protein
MQNYGIRIEIPEGEVKKILNELTQAQEKIRECYTKLENLGVITIVDQTISGN